VNPAPICNAGTALGKQRAFVTSQTSIGSNTVQLDGSGSSLTDNGGISLTSGTITGLGTVTGAISASLAAHITANGGTLTIASAITNTGTLALTITGASDRLKLNGASAASSLSFNGSSGTLELNTSGTLTVANALTVGTEIGRAAGRGWSLTDNNGMSLTSGTITGRGTVTGAISASGAAHITANGGTLTIVNGIYNTGTLALSVTGASDRLVLDGASAASSLSFNGSSGTLELNTSGTLTVANALTVGT